MMTSVLTRVPGRIDVPRPEPVDSTAAAGRSFIIAAVVTLALAIVPVVLWPGSASWMCDEPMLVSQALYYNQGHELAERGLGGTFFIPYGPFGTQFYQLMLLFTHDLRVFVVVRAFCCSAMLGGSLLWLSRSLKLTPWFAAAVVLAPYVGWCERVLWDASFAIPIGALAVAAYASFLRKGSRVSLAIAAAGATLMPMIHMQGLSLFFALAGHALWRHHREIRRHWISVALAVGFVLVLNVRYPRSFFEYANPRLVNMFKTGYGGHSSKTALLQSLKGPFLGGLLLNGDFDTVPRVGMPGPAAAVGWAIEASKAITPLIWLGIAVGLVRQVGLVIRRRWRRVGGNGAVVGGAWVAEATMPGAPAARDAISVRDTMVGIALIGLLLQLALAASLCVPPYPQYSFATFPFHVLFAWLAIEFLRRLWLGYLVTAAWGLALAYLTLGGAWVIHRDGWQRGCMSPSLDNQMEVARALNRYSDEAVWTNVPIYKPGRFSVAIRALRGLFPPRPGVRQVASPYGLLLRWKPGPDRNSSQIELIELDKDTQWKIPPDAEPLDVTKLPRLY